MTGISKGSFKSNIVESRPLVVVLLHKRNEGKHEIKKKTNPTLQALSQGAGTITQRAEAQLVPCPAHPPTCSDHPCASLQMSQRRIGQHRFICLTGDCTAADGHRRSPGANALPHLALLPPPLLGRARPKEKMKITASKTKKFQMGFFSLFWGDIV